MSWLSPSLEVLRDSALSLAVLGDLVGTLSGARRYGFDNLESSWERS